jgi:hypothetical protein
MRRAGLHHHEDDDGEERRRGKVVEGTSHSVTEKGAQLFVRGKLLGGQGGGQGGGQVGACLGRCPPTGPITTTKARRPIAASTQGVA